MARLRLLLAFPWQLLLALLLPYPKPSVVFSSCHIFREVTTGAQVPSDRNGSAENLRILSIWFLWHLIG